MENLSLGAWSVQVKDYDLNTNSLDRTLEVASAYSAHRLVPKDTKIIGYRLLFEPGRDAVGIKLRKHLANGRPIRITVELLDEI